MKLKKILAIALAATTALTLVPANAVEAKSTSTLASTSNYKTRLVKDSTFQVRVDASGNMLNKGVVSSGGGDLLYTYKVTSEASTTTDGAVKLTAVEYTDQTARDNTTSIKLPDEIPVGKITGSNEFADKAYKDDIESFVVEGIELNGEDFEKDGELITSIDLTSFDDATKKARLKTVKLENFTCLAGTNTFGSTITSGDFTKLETVDFSGSAMKYDASDDANNIAAFIFGSKGALETLDMSNLTKKDNNTWNTNTTAADLKPFDKLTTINVSDNDKLGTLRVKRATGLNGADKDTATSVNISGCDELRVLEATADAGYTGHNNDTVAGSYYAGIKFITSDGAEASRNLDLSAYSMTNVTVTNAQLEGFTAPQGYGVTNSNKSLTIDVSNNMISDINVSGAKSDLASLTANNNRILDIDLSGQDEMTNLNLADNYLTSLDLSGCDNLASLDVTNNYIPTDNYTKGEKKNSLSSQKTLTTYFTILGDGGMTDTDSDAQALVKLNGNANVLVAMTVMGAPAGFAEKLASTISWKEANTAGGAVSIGEGVIVEQKEEYKADVLGYQSSIVAAVPVTGAAERTGAEKVTVNYGGASDIINIGAADVAILTYDVTTNIDKDNVKESKKAEIAAAMFDYPQTAAVLSNGTAKVKTSANSPAGKEMATPPAAPTAGIGFKAYDMIKSTNTLAAYGVSVGTVNWGYKWNNFNTAQDGTGDSYKTGKQVTLTEDMTLYATYTEQTYNIAFNNNGGKSNTDKMSGIAYGDSATLNVNQSTNEDHTFEGWIKTTGTAGNNLTVVPDGATVDEFTVKATDSTVTLYALWSDNDNTLNLDESSVSLVVGTQNDNVYKVGDFNAKTTDQDGAAFGERATWSTDHKSPLSDNQVVYMTSDDGVVKYTDGVLVAKGAGTATVYAYDRANEALAAINVTVASQAEDQQKKADLAVQKKLDEGKEAVDVSEYSKVAAKVIKNADGENTVTIVEGKNVKTVKVNTITIGDKTYTVTRIDNNAFKGMNKITTVTTSNKVKVIGKAAFANCKKLKKVTLGKAVVSIKANAFKNDKNLAKILIKSKKLTSKKRVGKNSFKGIKKNAKFYIAKKAATYKKVKKAIKAQSGAPKKAKYVKKYA